jgi:hypothetical protein
MREFKLTRTRLALFSNPVLLCLIFPIVVLPLATWEAILPQGTGVAAFYAPSLLILLFLLIAAAVLISAAGLLFPSWRSGSLISFLICLASAVCFIGGGIAGGSISSRIHRHAQAQIVERSKPLVTAIKSYEEKFGHSPNSLEALVPEFISRVPVTGIGESPAYKFQLLTNSSTYGNNPWVLYVDTPGFSTFLYLPLQDYSVLSYGYVAWRVGDWAYWHQG